MIAVVGESPTHPGKPDSPVADYQVLEVLGPSSWRIQFDPPVPSPEGRIAELEAALAAVSDDQAERMALAEQARRDAYDAVLAGKTRTLTLVDQATKAGSVAFIGALQ